MNDSSLFLERRTIVNCENCVHIFILQEKFTPSWYENSKSVFRSSRTASKTPRRTASVWPRWFPIHFSWRWHDHFRWYGGDGWFKVQKLPMDRILLFSSVFVKYLRSESKVISSFQDKSYSLFLYYIILLFSVPAFSKLLIFRTVLLLKYMFL